MSYILDALKRADAERGTQQAPDVLGSNFAPPPHQPARKARAWYGLVALILVIGGAIVFAWLSPEKVEPAVADAESAMPAPAKAAASTAPRESLPAVAATVPPVPTTPPQEVPRPQAPPPLPPANAMAVKSSDLPQTIDVLAAGPSTPPVLATTTPTEPAPEAPPVPGPGSVPTTAGTSPAPNAPPPGASPQQILKRIPLPPGPTASKAQPTPPKVAVAGRPAAARSNAGQPPTASNIAHAGHPEMAITGTAYSTNPAHRMLIINGKVVKEGQDVSPGLTLESIGERTAVFNQSGSRFNINY